MKLAVVSMAEGPDWEKIAQFSFPTFAAFAERSGARFVRLRGRRLPDRHVHWEKLACATALLDYDRVMWLDADAIIRSTAPSVFDLVPPDAFGAFDEGSYVTSSDEEIRKGFEFYGVLAKPIEERSPKYFNAGMMVFSRMHRRIFDVPTRFFESCVPEQTYVNVRLQQLGFKFHDLGKAWNGYYSWHPHPDERASFHIIHYAGWGKSHGWEDAMLAQMKKDYR